MANSFSYEEVNLEKQTPTLSKSRQLFLLRCLSPKRLFKFSFSLIVIDLAIIGSLVYLVSPLIILLHRNDELFGPRRMPGGSVSENDTDPSQHTIPLILHQTSANDTIPQKWIESQQSCQSVYSNFTYMLWTDESAREFLSNEYPWFVDIWDNYAFPIQRADAIRYFMLYHYGGLYLDMDTVCLKPFPIFEGNSGSSEHQALFQSTKPTGVTNDVMISTARHPALGMAITELPYYFRWTRFWAKWQPYSNIMFSSGPMFISLVFSEYLRQQPSLPSPTFNVVTPHQMEPYITDLQSSTWHKGDARVLMWLGDRPWTWYTLAVLGCILGFSLVNHGLSRFYAYMFRAHRKTMYRIKQSKMT